MTEQSKIIKHMLDCAPPGQPDLDFTAREALRDMTAQLLDTTDAGEYHRYVSIADRDLGTAAVHAAARVRYAGKRVLVTGGTGCIGATLLRQLRALGVTDLFSVSLPSSDLDDALDPVPGVVYLEADLAHELPTRQLIREVAPDVIFHCAAQRSPWLAERAVPRTILSNVVGTMNVLQGARDADVELVVHASTGKAMRYYTTDVYAATKKLCEWLVHDYAREGRTAGLARFTHVVDNAVVMQKVDESASRPDGVMRVHDPDVFFYAQSAIESSQLLLLAGLNPQPELRALAIRELGDPVDLVQLVLGRMHDERCGYDPVIYFSGFDRGYERGNAPGLYDPLTAADVSPLINAVEAATTTPLDGFPGVDEFRIRLPRTGAQALTIGRRLRDLCHSDASAMDVTAELARAVATQADAFFGQVPERLFDRLDHMAHQSEASLPTSRVVTHAA